MKRSIIELLESELTCRHLQIFYLLFFNVQPLSESMHPSHFTDASGDSAHRNLWHNWDRLVVKMEVLPSQVYL